MYFSGHVGDRIDLRLFLFFGMIGSGIFTVLFGLGHWLDVHVLGFFVGVQIVCGLFQSIGWPCVVAVVGNWFGKSKRSLIMGIWTSHTSVGNIIDSVVASGVYEFGRGWSFAVPGLLIIIVGILVFLFPVVNPEDMGFSLPVVEIEMERAVTRNLLEMESEEAKLLESDSSDSYSSFAIEFVEAWKLPGVAPFSFCLFFSKLMAYTFLYWLPFYIRHTAVAGVHISHKTAGILSTIFDTGGVIGGILEGLISGMIEARAVTSILFLTLAIPALVFHRLTTAVAADLGTQSLNGGNSRVLATVTAIIDATGSVGAALGPLLAGMFLAEDGIVYFFC